MQVFIPTCNRADMAAKLVATLKTYWLKPVLFINNCELEQYRNIDCQKLYFDFDTDNPVICSNRIFREMVLHADTGDDLLIIEDDTEPCFDFVRTLFDRAEAIEADGWEKYTINPLYTPARNTRYTPHKDTKVRYNNFNFIHQNWVDTNLFIPQELLPEFQQWYSEAPPIGRRSNGIGIYHSRKMYDKGYPMFTCTPSLLGHGDHDSIIYPEGRRKVPLIAEI